MILFIDSSFMEVFFVLSLTDIKVQLFFVEMQNLTVKM